MRVNVTDIHRMIRDPTVSGGCQSGSETAGNVTHPDTIGILLPSTKQP
jgi:hypothetical protein